MVARNDITGDEIKSRVNSKKLEENWDNIFGKKKKTNGGWVPPPLPNDGDWDENRTDIVGQNGNEGLHYETDS